MQEAILQIGQAVYEEENYIKNILQPVTYQDKKGKPKHVVKLCFDTEQKKVALDILEEMDEYTAEKYSHIGNNPAASLKWYAALEQVEYFLSETVSNWLKLDFSDEWKRKFNIILESFYTNLPIQGADKKTEQYFLNLKQVGMGTSTPSQIYQSLMNQSGSMGSNATQIVRQVKKELSKDFFAFVKKQYGLSKQQLGLFVIVIDGQVVSQTEEYRKLVRQEKMKAYENEKGEQGKCSLCQATKDLSWDTSKLRLKFYTITNINFPSGFSKKNYRKNMLICKDCMNYLEAGEKYLISYCRGLRLGSFTIYLVPHFIYVPYLDRTVMEQITAHIRNVFQLATDYTKVLEMSDEIRMELDSQQFDTYFLLNILFYAQENQAVKVQRLIKDIHPGRFKALHDASQSVGGKMSKYFGSRLNWYMDLKGVYYLTPIRVSKGNPQEYKKLLVTYDSIFQGRMIEKRKLFEQFAKLARVVQFEQFEQYNINSGKLFDAMIKANAYFQWLKEINCIRRGKGMDTSILHIQDTDMKNYIEQMESDERETALFLLGILLGEIGTAQYKNRKGKKPILNKINFHGMDKSRIFRLSNRVLDMLKQNKCLSPETEAIYAEHKTLLACHAAKWEMNPQQALFYLLTGYSYQTQKNMLKSKEGGIQNEQQ